MQKAAAGIAKRGKRKLPGAQHNVLTANLVSLLRTRFRAYVRSCEGELAEQQSLLHA